MPQVEQLSIAYSAKQRIRQVWDPECRADRAVGNRTSTTVTKDEREVQHHPGVSKVWDPVNK